MSDYERYPNTYVYKDAETGMFRAFYEPPDSADVINLFTTEPLSINTGPYIGFLFVNGAEKEMYRITCPCGVEVVYGVNNLPEVDTPHPCGDPTHWTVKYQAGGV